MPGFAYQLGILFAAPTNSIEFALRNKFGYPWALGVFETVNITALAITLWLGSENKGRSFLLEETSEGEIPVTNQPATDWHG
jgi:hypothetical protein